MGWSGVIRWSGVMRWSGVIRCSSKPKRTLAVFARVLDAIDRDDRRTVEDVQGNLTKVEVNKVECVEPSAKDLMLVG